jgi:hypothetical protein
MPSRSPTLRALLEQLQPPNIGSRFAIERRRTPSMPLPMLRADTK